MKQHCCVARALTLLAKPRCRLKYDRARANSVSTSFTCCGRVKEKSEALDKSDSVLLCTGKYASAATAAEARVNGVPFSSVCFSWCKHMYETVRINCAMLLAHTKKLTLM